MDAYLRRHPPRRSQFRSPRRQKPSGVTVLHTAENVMDTVGPDTGAEGVANFIVNRAEPGSYHDIVDSDSGVYLVRYGDEAFQDGTGSNPHALSISWALRASDWGRLTPAKRAAFLRWGALAFVRQQRWLQANNHPTTPLKRITRAQSAEGIAGFVTHGDRDPGRRSDPGAGFPWTEFLDACEAALNGKPGKTPSTTPTTVQEDDMTRLFLDPDGATVWAATATGLLHVKSQEALARGRRLGLLPNVRPEPISAADLGALADDLGVSVDDAGAPPVEQPHDESTA